LCLFIDCIEVPNLQWSSGHAWISFLCICFFLFDCTYLINLCVDAPYLCAGIKRHSGLRRMHHPEIRSSLIFFTNCLSHLALLFVIIIHKLPLIVLEGKEKVRHLQHESRELHNWSLQQLYKAIHIIQKIVYWQALIECRPI
jgi:hypothetical protein